MLLGVAVVAVVAAAAGPVYLRAADQSIVETTMSGASVLATGLTIRPAASGYAAAGVLRRAATAPPGGAGQSPGDLFHSPIETIDVTGAFFSPYSGRPDGLDLIYRSGECAHLQFVAGHCPSGRREIALSTRSAKQIRSQVGHAVTLLTPTGRRSAVLTLAGVFKPGNPSAPYWWGSNFFPFGYPATKGQGELLDDGFVSLRGADSLAGSLPTSDWAQVALRPSALPAPRLPSAVAAVGSWSGRLTRTTGLQVSTSLASVAARAERGESQAGTMIAVITLQLVLLALLVLYSLARATSSLRAPDVRVAELRGLPRGRIALIALREPIMIMAAALPIGIGVTYAVMSVVDRAVIGRGVPTDVDSLALGVSVAACFAGILSVAVASRHLFTGQVGLEEQAAAVVRRSNRAAVADALAVVLAIAGVVELVSQHGRSVSPISYLGPGLIALAAGVLAARLLPLAARAFVRRSGWSHGIPGTLASRDLARRQEVARQALVPAIATGLLVFAVAGLVVSGANRRMQAGFTLGAPVVLHVATSPGTNLLAAVRSADPSGREAMAAVVTRTSYGRTLAVDSTRFARIASWPPSASREPLSRIVRSIAPRVPPAREIPRSTRLELAVTDASRLRPGPDLQVSAFDPNQGSEQTLQLGPLRPGRHVYSASLSGFCLSGCRLDQIMATWRASPQTRASAAREETMARHVRVVLDSVLAETNGAARALPMLLDRAGAWSAGPATRATATPRGLELRMNLVSTAGSPSVSPVDLPRQLPVVATRRAIALSATPGQPRQAQAIGLDGNELTARASAVVGVLPAVGNNATLMDLGFARREQTGAYAGATLEVWCHEPPSKGLLERLRHDGVSVLSERRAAELVGRLGRSGPSLGFELDGLAALAAALLAVGSLLFAFANTARERRIELASLSAIGVSRRNLLKSLVVQSSVVALTAALAGTLAAVVSAKLALAFLPEFAPGRVGPPLDVAVPAGGVVLAALATLALLEAAVVLASFLVVRGVRPDQLRLAR